MVKVKRSISLDVVVYCCKPEEGIKYTSESNRLTYEGESSEFKESLVLWRDRMLDFIDSDLEETVDTELCKKISASLIYCRRDISNVEVEERTVEIIEKIPPVVELPKREKELIELLETRIKEAETVDEKLALQEEIDKIKKRYGVIG